jgi:hypothetical protein
VSTTFEELIRQTMLKLQPRNDGITRLMVEQSINDAQKVIAMVMSSDALTALDTTHAYTAADQKIYHIVDDLQLVRPKDILSIRLMDEANSRKLHFVPASRLDRDIPYTEITGTDRSSYYTRRGKYLEFYPIPNAVYALYIHHTQWPAILEEDDDETEFENIDFVIAQLAADMTLSNLEGSSGDWTKRAQALLSLTVAEEITKPDERLVAQPFCASSSRRPPGEYWLNPWVKD